jgi:serine/threonine-protein kinase
MVSVTTVSTTPAVIGASDQDLAVGTEVGEYKIEAVIGQGGFGTVYRAQHPLIGKLVAIKVLARKYSSDPAVVSRFVAEARAVNQIRHRNIIDIFLFSQLPDGRHYYVMEHLDGEPLDGYLKRCGPLPLAEAMPILRAIARALDAAHAKGIAHRDLKPENIFLAIDPDGAVFPKLLDFGIAKLLAPPDEDADVRHRTATGVPLGTPYYMSPEQCRGRDVDHRTDVYSCGIVAFRMLTGTYPFEGEDYVELLFKQVNEAPPLASSRNPALPASVDTAIAWMLRKDRDQRPPTVLEGVLALDPGAAETPGVLPKRASRPSVAPAQTAPADAFAATTAHTPATIATKKSRPLVWIGASLVLVCSAAALLLVFDHGTSSDDTTSTSTSAKPTIVSTNVAQPQPPPPPPPPIETPPVAITFTKVPRGATATLDGKPIVLADKLVLPHGTTAMQLVISAPRLKSRTIELVPDRDQSIDVHLDAANLVGRPHGPTDEHDIIDSGAIFGPKHK